MRAALLALALVLVAGGCSDPVLTAARITLAADQAVLEGESQFGAWDLEHQRSLTDAQLVTYREQQRPKVLAGLQALTAAAHEARIGVELAHNGKLEAGDVTHAICSALVGVADAGRELGWQAQPLALGVSLCRLVAP